jgi:hypothetical protein
MTILKEKKEKGQELFSKIRDNSHACFPLAADL